MKKGLIYQLNHDVRNIIETMDFQYRMKNTNNEYSRVFHFFDNLCSNYTCPNPSGRCVVRWKNVKVHWLDGQRHREDGPAIEWADGTKWWYLNNQLHRKDDPAIDQADRYKARYYKNQLHRNSKEGPAIEYANNHPNEYWEFDKRIIK